MAEVLTQDALRLAVGDPVRLTASGLGASLDGRVKRVEPAGFTKLGPGGLRSASIVWSRCHRRDTGC